MTSAVGVDLDGLDPFPLNPLGIIGRLQVTFNHGHPDPIGQAFDRPLQQRRFTRPGRTHQVEDKDARVVKTPTIRLRQPFIGLQDISHHRNLNFRHHHPSSHLQCSPAKALFRSPA